VLIGVVLLEWAREVAQVGSTSWQLIQMRVNLDQLRALYPWPDQF